MVQGKMKKMKAMIKERFVPETRGMNKRIDKMTEELMKMQQCSEGRPYFEEYAKSEATLCSRILGSLRRTN